MASHDIDFSSGSWHAVVRWAEAELADARTRNDAPSLNETETATLRGDIQRLKKLITLPRISAVEKELARPATAARDFDVGTDF